MAAVDKRLCSGLLTDTNSTLYTAPATSGLKTIIKALVICNSSAVAVPVTLKLDGIAILSGFSLAANASHIIPYLDQIIEASELIEGLAGTTSVVSYYISGKEITA